MTLSVFLKVLAARAGDPGPRHAADGIEPLAAP
jgi:hypothetical protein